MPYLDPAKMKRPAPVVETRTFVSARYPDMPWTLTLRALAEAPFRLAIEQKVEDNSLLYVLGAVMAESDVGPAVVGEDGVRHQPISIIMVSDESGEKRPVTVSPLLCRWCTYIEEMQIPDAGDPPYTFEKLVEMAVVNRDAFVEAGGWARKLIDSEGRRPEGQQEPANP